MPPLTAPIIFSERLAQRVHALGPVIRPNKAHKTLLWIVDSKVRNAVGLSTWLREQYVDDRDAVRNYATMVERCVKRHGGIPDTTFDKIAVIALQEVTQFLQYRRDVAVHAQVEKWQTIDDTLRRETGDCEDGAILLYKLLRTLGVPAHRLLIWLGDAINPHDKGVVGHACLAYVPDRMPFNVIMLDWCYNPSNKHINGVEGRTIYTLHRNEIIALNGENIYQRTWFLFNEQDSYTTVQYAVVRDV